MECIVTIGAIVVIGLAIYFQIRLRALEKKSREIDALKAEMHSFRAMLGIESAPQDVPTVAPLDADAQSTLSGISPVPPTPTPTPPQVPTPKPAAATQPAPAIPAPMVVTPTSAPEVAAAIPVVAARGPSLAERMPDSPLWRWFMGSHMVVRVGIAILFIGVAFLLKYAADQGWLSIDLRLAGAGVLGVGLVYAGWRLRNSQRIYALTLQGGGIGIAYLTTFVAFRFYERLPAPLAFALLVAIGITCGVLAVLNDAKALALPTIIGGFAAPLLVTTEGGSHVTLFSYITLLNAAILLIAWYKSWRELNLVGFLFTLVLASWWGGAYYQPEYFTTVEPFLLLFFAFYLAIGLLFARRQPPRLVGLVDGPLVFLTPAIVMGWQALLVRDTAYGLAWSAAGMGLLYLLLFVALGRASANYTHLRESYLAIGTVLLTLAVPFAVDGQLTSAIWALAGAGILWIGLRQARRFHILWGGLIQLGAAFFFTIELMGEFFASSTGEPSRWLGLLDSVVVSGVLIAVAALITGYLTLMAVRRGEQFMVKGDLRLISWGATLWGLWWWYGTGIYALSRYFMDDSGNLTLISLFVVLTAIVGEWLGGRFHWRAIRLTSLLLWAAIALVALLHAIFYGALFVGLGWLVWPAAVVVHYWMLYRLDHVAKLRIYHAIGLWLLAGLAMTDLIADDLTWQGNQLWAVLAVLAVPILLILLVSLLGKRLPWPTAKHYTHYMTIGLAPLLFIVVGISVINNLSHNGDSTPFAYLPLLNPVSIAHIIILGTLAVWIVQMQKNVTQSGALRPAWVAGAFLCFLWLNADIARIIHHFWGVPFQFSDLLRSSLLQSIYSIFWTLLAMTLMFIGTRTARRFLWLFGAALLAVTVIKLLVIDLSAADTLARIVSFIVVGLLMLLIGYVSPIPPATHKEEAVGG